MHKYFAKEKMRTGNALEYISSIDKETINVTLHSRHKPRQGSTRRGYEPERRWSELAWNGEARLRSPVQHANGSVERSFAFPKRSLNSCQRQPAHFSTDEELDPSFSNSEGARHLPAIASAIE